MEKNYIDCNFCKMDRTKKLFIKDGFNIVRCRNCGLVYVNPRLTGECLKNKYQEEYYIQEYHTASNFISQSEQLLIKNLYIGILKRVEFYIKKVKNRNYRLLDIGCGVGNFLAFVKEQGWDSIGVEVSDFASKWVADNIGCKVYRGEFLDLELEEESFDVITMISVIEHLPDPVGYIKKVYRFLSKNGIFVISTLNFKGISTRILAKDSYAIEPDEHIYYFTKEILGDILRYHNFRILKIQTVNIYLLNIILFFERKLNLISKDKVTSSYERYYSIFQNLSCLRYFIRLLNFFLNMFKIGDNLIIYSKKR